MYELFDRLLVSSIGAEKTPVYTYIFDSPIRSTNCVELFEEIGFNPATCFYPAHGSELPYVFHSEKSTG